MSLRGALDPAGTTLLENAPDGTPRSWPLSLDPQSTGDEIGTAAAALVVFAVALHYAMRRRHRRLFVKGIAIAGVAGVVSGIVHRLAGIEHLYGGPLGEAIDRLMRERGGLLTLSALRNYPAGLRWTAPIQTTYRGVTVYAPPPPTSAVQALETLNVLETFDLENTGHLSPDHLAVVAEAARAARLDTDRFAGDPAFVAVPVDRLLSAEHTKELRAELGWRLGVP